MTKPSQGYNAAQLSSCPTTDSFEGFSYLCFAFKHQQLGKQKELLFNLFFLLWLGVSSPDATLPRCFIFHITLWALKHLQPPTQSTNPVGER